MRNFLNTCYTCTHWKGDKARMTIAIEDRGDIVMDLDDGWPTDGYCNKILESINLDIDGDASVGILLDANFGCLYYEEDSALS